MAAARYRERHAVTRKKSDHLDALVLANILRTDRAACRTLPCDSELAQAIAVLARAQQDAVWDRTQSSNRLRSRLRERAPRAGVDPRVHQLAALAGGDPLRDAADGQGTGRTDSAGFEGGDGRGRGSSTG